MTGETIEGTTLVEPPKMIKTNYAVPADYVGIFVIGFFIGFFLCYQVASISYRNLKLSS